MKLQINGCYYSEPIICPKDWKSGGRSLLKKDWYVYYRYHDPLFKDRYPGGKPCPVKSGVNRYKTLEERRIAIQELYETETQSLERGYNAITKTMMETAVHDQTISDTAHTITESMPFTEALKEAQKRVNVAKSTADNISSVLRYFIPAAKKLRYADLPINSITRKHIRLTLDQVGIEKGEKWTANNFNYYRSHLMILFSELTELEVIAGDPAEGIKKRKVTRKIRQILTTEERQRIDRHLRLLNPRFWLFIHIFFHSGSRITEIMRLKASDVDIEKQRIKYLVKKGNEYREVFRTIKNIALPLWQEALRNCKPDQYIFSRGLLPGDQPIQSYQITRRWKRWIKDNKDLKITCDFYSLKHSNTDEISALLGINDAAALNSHTEEMARKHYAVTENERQHERLKSVSNAFA